MIGLSQGRLQDRRPLSIIDIGSNSIRLVVYEGIARSPTVLFNEKMLAGLGRGIVSTGKLDPEAVKRAVEEFRRFRALSEQAGSEQLYVIATAAAREAENGMDFIHRAEEILGTEIRVLSRPRGGALLGARRHLRLPSGQRHRRRPRRRQPRAGRRQRRGDRRGHHAAARRPAAAGPVQGLAGRRRRNSCASSWPAPSCWRAGEGRAFYAVGGTWRNLARLHMNAINYPLAVMHHYELGIESSADFLRQVGRGEMDKIKRHRARLEEPPRTAALWRDRAAGDHRGDAAVEDRRLGARRARGLPLFAAVAGRAALRSADLGVRGAGAAAGPARSPMPTSSPTGPARPSPPSASTRPRTRCATGGPPACSPTSAGAPIPNIAARSRSTSSRTPPSSASTIPAAPSSRSPTSTATKASSTRASPRRCKALAPPRYLDRARVLGATLRVVYLLSASMPGVIPKLRWERRDNGVLALVIPAFASPARTASARPAAWRSSPGSPAGAWCWRSARGE